VTTSDRASLLSGDFQTGDNLADAEFALKIRTLFKHYMMPYELLMTLILGRLMVSGDEIHQYVTLLRAVSGAYEQDIVAARPTPQTGPLLATNGGQIATIDSWRLPDFPGGQVHGMALSLEAYLEYWIGERDQGHRLWTDYGTMISGSAALRSTPIELVQSAEHGNRFPIAIWRRDVVLQLVPLLQQAVLRLSEHQYGLLVSSIQIRTDLVVACSHDIASACCLKLWPGA